MIHPIAAIAIMFASAMAGLLAAMIFCALAGALLGWGMDHIEDWWENRRPPTDYPTGEDW